MTTLLALALLGCTDPGPPANAGDPDDTAIDTPDDTDPDTSGDSDDTSDDSAIDTDSGADTGEVDADGDGFPSWRTARDPATADCDDADPAVTPASEVYVPAGAFVRGFDGEAFSAPARSITLSAYCIDRLEVTNEAFVELLTTREAAGSHNVDDLGRMLFDVDDADDTFPERITFTDGAWAVSEGYDRHPVTEVWHWSGLLYCETNGKTLPTEAQWEKAARGATDARTWPWGEDPPDCARANHAYFQDDAIQLCVGDTSETGTHDNASPYGVLDLAGNVSEWVSDWFDPDGYATDADTDPTGPAEGQLFADEKGSFIARIARGGTFLNSPEFMRVSARAPEPEWATSNGVGFRCARPLAE